MIKLLKINRIFVLMDLLDKLVIAYQEGKFEKRRLQTRETLLNLVLVGGIENYIAKQLLLRTTSRTYVTQSIYEKFSYILGYL